ncbi:DUF305 domain-containing protein [Pseudonocardia hydrocarbonoxydans]|uniref:Uncharacterized protein n=1 Tax=Pseudonocardia hydrocarbonoxydans TaxID=76726 RepID=A0A4Y3WUF6_9PSEU|nr:DUF305 domain-containing protein [Pseudonocardia hydrocarbonoxydans]GEC20986.1 hypothetical protein PHY01_32690 [Pseudonocardia hydrocarbonoxydans]
MNQLITRAFSPELEVRSAGDGRTVTGVAVPYGRPQRIDSTLTEQFRRGAFNAAIRAAHRVPFTREHLSMGGALIGRLTALRDDEAGLYFEARVSPTVAGDETLALLRDGALESVSIGFRARQNRRLADGTIERVTADLRELAVVLEGAYGEHALVSSVRAADTGLSDADTAFLRAMIAHHGSALDMARDYLAGSPSSPQVMALADRIVTGQAAEVEMMRGWLADTGGAPAPDDAMGMRSVQAARILRGLPLLPLVS